MLLELTLQSTDQVQHSTLSFIPVNHLELDFLVVLPSHIVSFSKVLKREAAKEAEFRAARQKHEEEARPFKAFWENSSGSTADISPHSVATLTGFLRSGLRPGVHSRW